MDEVTKRIVVRGRVQGVGFRYSMADRAEFLGLRGWVRNRMDGSVEALAQGPDALVDELVEWVRKGPPVARVDAVDVSDAASDEGANRFSGFSIG